MHTSIIYTADSAKDLNEQYEMKINACSSIKLPYIYYESNKVY